MNKTIAKRQKREKQLLIENLKVIPIIEACCKKSGIGRATFYRWRAEDKEFAKEAEQALDEGLKLINDIAEGKIIGAIHKDNLTAAMYWLNHRHPAYGNKLEVTAVRKDEEEQLTAGQQKAVRKALELTGFVQEKTK